MGGGRGGGGERNDVPMVLPSTIHAQSLPANSGGGGGGAGIVVGSRSEVLEGQQEEARDGLAVPD